MAFHKMVLIGKLVGDPRENRFDNGGAVAKFGLPVNFTRPKKNQETGEWEGESFIIDVDCFNSERRKLADVVMQYLKKGSQVYVEGRVRLNEFTNRDGVKVSKPVLVADVLEFLDGKESQGGDRISPPQQRPAPAPRRGNAPTYADEEPAQYEQPDSEIPF